MSKEVETACQTFHGRSSFNLFSCIDQGDSLEKARSVTFIGNNLQLLLSVCCRIVFAWYKLWLFSIHYGNLMYLSCVL